MAPSESLPRPRGIPLNLVKIKNTHHPAVNHLKDPTAGGKAAHDHLPTDETIKFGVATDGTNLEGVAVAAILEALETVVTNGVKGGVEAHHHLAHHAAL